MSEPFFVIEDVIAATLDAAVQARKTAWEYRRAGRETDYKRKIRDAVWYRKRARGYLKELETADGKAN